MRALATHAALTHWPPRCAPPQVRTNHRRIGGHFLQPSQANFLMPSAARGGGLGGPVRRDRGHQVMMVTANQPLPCTTRRGDWIMELALRNKLMCARARGAYSAASERRRLERVAAA